MVNGKCPTWFVVKWLEKHQTHTAKAPRTERHEMKAFASCDDQTVEIHWFSGTSWRRSYTIVQRSDWTIYNEHGKRVRFKVRQPSVTAPDYGTLTVRDARGNVTEVWKALNGQLDVFIRERSR